MTTGPKQVDSSAVGGGLLTYCGSAMPDGLEALQEVRRSRYLGITRITPGCRRVA